MKNLIESFNNFINKEELDEGGIHTISVSGSVVYSVNLFIKIKRGEFNIEQVLNRIRAIPGVTVIRQEGDAESYPDYWVVELTIKFTSLGMSATSYVRKILVRHISSNSKSIGVPSTTIRYVNWRSLQEI